MTQPERTILGPVQLAFVNSEGNYQVVTPDPCPECRYPERHRVYDMDAMKLIADGCPSCETPRTEQEQA